MAKTRAAGKSKAPQFEVIARAISREGPQGLPEFPCKLHVVEEVRGEPAIYEEMPGQVLQLRNEAFVTQQILNFVARKCGGRYVFDARDAINCGMYWKNYTQRLDSEILPVLQKSEIGFTYHRLPWDFEDGPTPVWDEMFSRMNNADAGMAWIGSLFVPESDRQQYWWIHGDGGNGKGALNRFLHQVFNGAYKSEVPPAKGDKFWTSGLLGSRVVAFAECENYNFPSSGLFKLITGGDPIRVEKKREASFSAKLVCKLLFLSNQKPNITGAASDKRRAIFSEISPITCAVMNQGAYNDLLWDEGPSFLYKCLKKYYEMCPNHGPINSDDEVSEQLIFENEEEIRTLTDEFFIKDEKGFVPSLDMMKIRKHRRIGDFQYKRWLEYMKREFQISSGKKHEGLRGWKGIKRWLGDREFDKAVGVIKDSIGDLE